MRMSPLSCHLFDGECDWVVILSCTFSSQNSEDDVLLPSCFQSLWEASHLLRFPVFTYFFLFKYIFYCWSYYGYLPSPPTLYPAPSSPYGLPVYMWLSLGSLQKLLGYFIFRSHLKFYSNVPSSELNKFFYLVILHPPPWALLTWKLMALFCSMLSCASSLKTNYFCFQLLLRWMYSFLLHYVTVMKYVNWFSNIKSTLRSWDRPDVVMIYYYFILYVGFHCFPHSFTEGT